MGPGARRRSPEPTIPPIDGRLVATELRSLLPNPSLRTSLALDAASYASERNFILAQIAPVSTFSLQVDTANYARVREAIEGGKLPAPDLVRLEELINAFSYTPPPPKISGPVAASVEVAAAPWNPQHRLVRIALAGRATEAVYADAERPVADDIAVQVEFNPAQAQAYRLIGYEARAADGSTKVESAREPVAFAAGQGVTVFYEVVPAPAITEATPETKSNAAAKSVAWRELLTLKIAFTEPRIDVRRNVELPAIDVGTDFAAASRDFLFSAAVADLGLILRSSEPKPLADYDRVIVWAEAGRGPDLDGRRGEFISLVKKARAIAAGQTLPAGS